MKDLDKPVFKASLIELEDLWAVRFGDNWVALDDIVDDENFSAVAVRLLAANRLERHVVIDRNAEVYKLIREK